MPAMADMTLWVRDNPITSAENTAGDVKHTFSSWDACMDKSYCKWPVIVAIIIASLILLSIISCLVRCLCCGLECCCGCFRCFNACCECCTPRRNRREKYRDVDDAPFGHHNPYGGYQPPPAAPTYIIQQSAPPQAQRYEPSRNYASFETGGQKRGVAGSTVHDDALPSMPTWSDAQNSHVPDQHHYQEEEVEMDHLNYHPPTQQTGMLAHQAPTPSAQTEGMGLYNDTPTHHADGDLGGAAVAAGGVHPAYRQDHGYTSPGGYVSPPAHDPYAAPHGEAAEYYQQSVSPPPSYRPAPAAGGLPSALTPGGGAQSTGVTGGYNAYQGGHGYRDV